MRSYNLGGFFYMSLRYDVLILFSENTFNIYFLESINTCQKIFEQLPTCPIRHSGDEIL